MIVHMQTFYSKMKSQYIQTVSVSVMYPLQTAAENRFPGKLVLSNYRTSICKLLKPKNTSQISNVPASSEGVTHNKFQ